MGDAFLDEGQRVRREVLGAEHVAAAEAATTSLDKDFQEFITRTAWGGVWARPGLDRRVRSLITVAVLAALGREEELELHLRATRHTNTTPEEVAEALLHVAVYAGIPAANQGFKLAKQTLQEDSPEINERE